MAQAAQTGPDGLLRVAVVTGSTRPGRKSADVARWVLDQAEQRDDASFELVDIADYGLPLLDEPMPASFGDYTQEHTKAWSKAIASFDAFVFVTPEYNRSIPGALKNAIDYLYREWNDKAAGFVGYGGDYAGGARAIEQLRLIMSEVQVAVVRMQVCLSLREDFEGFTTLAPRPHNEERLPLLLDQVVAWGRALRGARVPAAA